MTHKTSIGYGKKSQRVRELLGETPRPELKDIAKIAECSMETVYQQLRNPDRVKREYHAAAPQPINQMDFIENAVTNAFREVFGVCPVRDGFEPQKPFPKKFISLNARAYQ